ncbi:hypothetical protein [Streptomyces lavendofoliae]|uniref:hypothetical protein n=1 Tax=Streptomyces lavendofoliae TaxID=67314 RepID=UPI00300F3475
MKRIVVAAGLVGGIVALGATPGAADPNPGGLPSVPEATQSFEGLDMEDIINKVEQVTQGR